MFKQNVYNFQEISIKPDKPESIDNNQYCLDLFFRVSSIIIFLFSLWLVSILVYYSFK
jgi:hypothetical protein